MSEEQRQPMDWPGAAVAIAFFMLLGSLMYFNYDCSCKGCTHYSCTSPADRKASP